MSEGNLAVNLHAPERANAVVYGEERAGRTPTDSQRAGNPGSPNASLWERQLPAWELLGPPLRPSPEDVASFEAIVVACGRACGRLRGLVLGATPELARLRWGAHAQVWAVDRSPAMLEHVWPGHPAPGQGGLCADWQRLPLPDHSCDVVLGDGSFTQLEFPAGYRGVAQSIRQVLNDCGVAAFRCFVKPEKPEAPERVVADLWAGHIPNFHVFKWRLAMALQPSVEEGVELHAVWTYWAQAVDPVKLARHLRWPPEVIATMNNYRGLRARYTFPTLAQLRQVLRPDLIEVRCEFPSYALGDRCPLLTLQPRLTPSPAEAREF